jgi:hypothetical protein
LAFPEVDDAQRAAWARDLWLQLGRAAWEFARLARLSPEAYLASVDVRGLDRVQASAAAGKGVLLFTAHIGNWEYTTPFLSLAGLRLAVIARRIKNPYVDALVTAVRARFNTRVIRHREAVRESLRWLRSGGVLGLLFDQRITEGGLSVPFFGRPARTTGLPALLALRVGCPVHPVHSPHSTHPCPMNHNTPDTLSSALLAANSVTTYRRRTRRLRRIAYVCFILAGLLLLLWFARRTEAAGPLPPPDPATQQYYTCRYLRHEATSPACLRFRPHRGARPFKPIN